MHVLVIEDDPTFSYLLSTHLARSGHQVTVAENGIDGNRMASRERPDLIIVDYLLPDVDGLTVAGWLGESSLTTETPVILLTGAELREIAGKSMGSNVVDVLSKQTLTEEELVTAIDNAILSQASTGENPRALLFPGE